MEATKKKLELKQLLTSNGPRVILMIVVLYLFSGILEPNYLAPSHIMSVLVLCSFLGIICIGQTLVTALAKDSFLGIRYCVLVWVALGILTIFLLKKTSFGRKIFAVGCSSRVTDLSAINTKAVLIGVYVIASVMMAIAGILLIGHLGYPNYTMADDYQLISIAAVVIGGTSILGGHGDYLGTMGGVIIIYLIQSLLIILNMAEAGREIVNGAIILIILLAYGRGKKQSA